MLTDNLARLMTLIKQREIYIARLRILLDQAKKDNRGDVFKLNREIKKQIDHGKVLVDQYNSIVKKQKEERQSLIAMAEREEAMALRRIRENFRYSFENTEE